MIISGERLIARTLVSCINQNFISVCFALNAVCDTDRARTTETISKAALSWQKKYVNQLTQQYHLHEIYENAANFMTVFERKETFLKPCPNQYLWVPYTSSTVEDSCANFEFPTSITTKYGW